MAEELRYHYPLILSEVDYPYHPPLIAEGRFLLLQPLLELVVDYLRHHLETSVGAYYPCRFP